MQNEFRLEWSAPSGEQGKCRIHVANLRRREAERLARHEMAVMIAFERHEAEVTIGEDFVRRYGRQRCWWLMKEEICEQRFLLPLHLEKHLEEALEWSADFDGWDAALVG